MKAPKKDDNAECARGSSMIIQVETESEKNLGKLTELENSYPQKDLHALRIGSVVKSVSAGIEKITPGRIKIKIEEDFSVFANRIHLDQVVTNLVTNALKFSRDDKKVSLLIGHNFLLVLDSGNGVSEEVTERLDDAFNVGAQN